MSPAKFTLIRHCENESATLIFAHQLAQILETGMVLFLEGSLGAGKTTLTRGILSGLGFTGKVKSPTYALVEAYVIHHQKIFHFDLYRLKDPHELNFIGLEDYFIPDAICIVEWPEQGLALLPQPDLVCSIHLVDEGREFHVTAHTERGKNSLAKII